MSSERPTRLWHLVPTAGDLRLIAALIVAGAIVLCTALVVADQLDTDPGSTADWIAGVSTFAALLAASYAAVQTSRTFRLEQRRDRQRDEVARQHQAVLVAVWGSIIEHRGPRVTQTFRMGLGLLDQRTVDPGPVYPVSAPVTIKNASPLPVFKFDVEFYFVHPSDGSTALAGTYRYPGVVLGELPGVEIMTPEMVELVVAALTGVPGAEDGPMDFRIGWSFEDIAGVRWRRHPDGLLVEVDR